MAFNLTVEHVSAILKGNKEPAAWHKALVKILPKYKIDTAERIAMFLAQCGHESNNFTDLEENLNYSAKQLQKTWPKRFDAKLAAQVAGQPQRIAEIAYGGRLGNTQPNDGWKFRGQGIIQLTGRENYTKFGMTLNKSADQVADYVKTKEGAVDSAGWFWTTRNLNKPSDKGDVTGATELINGAFIGLEDRKERYQRAIEVLTGKVVRPAPVVTVTPVPSVAPAVIRGVKLGSRGAQVRKIQEALSIEVDGQFGPATEAALKTWQEANGFEADGVATAAVLAKLLK